MKSIEASLQTLARAVFNEARTEAEQILADAREKADAIRRRAEEQAAAERETILEHARQEATHIRSQTIASAQLQARKVLLERREALLNRVFEAARQRLSAIPQCTDYEQIVHQLSREAVMHLDTDTVLVCADVQTERLLTDDKLRAIGQDLGVTLHRGATLEQGVGVVVKTANGHRQYDNTLEARLYRQQDELRAAVYHLLMGEPL